MAKVTLYSKPECPLCDDARRALERVQAATPFDLEEIDITSRAALFQQYKERIPVVAIDGRDAFEYFVDEAVLRERLGRGPGG